VKYKREWGGQGRLERRNWRQQTLRRGGGVKVVSKRVYRREGNDSSKEETAAAKEGRRKVRGGGQVQIRLGVMTWATPLLPATWSYTRSPLTSLGPIMRAKDAHPDACPPCDDSFLRCLGSMRPTRRSVGKGKCHIRGSHFYDNDRSSGGLCARINQSTKISAYYFRLITVHENTLEQSSSPPAVVRYDVHPRFHQCGPVMSEEPTSIYLNVCPGQVSS